MSVMAGMGAEYGEDTSVWPNRVSRANSDRWLVENHDRIRRMEPRVLVVNFSNQATRAHLDGLVRDLIRALAEGSRYRGYTDAKAPAFLNYQLFKFVDLSEPGSRKPNSSKAPLKKGPGGGPLPSGEMNTAYAAFYGREFADLYGVKDPDRPDRNLDLATMVDRGLVHELWMIGEGAEDWVALESVEWKPVYGQDFRREGDRHVQAGNGGDDEMTWTGRSLRVGFINASRGVGCFMESLSHSMEGMAHSGAIPYFTKYFHEFAGFDLDRRHGLPWNSFYALWGEDKGVEYPDPSTAVVRDGAKIWRLTNYVAAGGNVHFSPNGRSHYDMGNTNPVMSTIEDWRMGNGPGGKDLARPWTVAAYGKYLELAPDCMGAWLVYWRQNFPGLDNRQKDDEGRPMKNWWPFLFY